MGALLDAVRAEIEPLQARLAKLREIEQRVVALDGEPEPAAAAKPRVESKRTAKPKTKPTSGRDGLGAKAQQVLEAVRAHDGWTTRSAIATRLPSDMSGDAISAHLTKLIDRGLLEAQGAQSTRKVRAVRSGKPRGTLGVATEGMAGGAADRKRSRAFIPQVRDAILNHVASVPSTEQQLADRYARDGIDREDIADICGALLLADKITLDPDGTYRVPAPAEATA